MVSFEIPLAALEPYEKANPATLSECRSRREERTKAGNNQDFLRHSPTERPMQQHE